VIGGWWLVTGENQTATARMQGSSTGHQSLVTGHVLVVRIHK
jgi:hypothetical protein